jgi:hypothetical protein
MVNADNAMTIRFGMVDRSSANKIALKTIIINVYLDALLPNTTRMDYATVWRTISELRISVWPVRNILSYLLMDLNVYAMIDLFGVTIVEDVSPSTALIIPIRL